MEILKENTLQNLFDYDLEKEHIFNETDIINLQIVQLKLKESDKQKKLYLATLRDKTKKYNGFILKSQDEMINEGNIINLKTVVPKNISKGKGRIFVCKEFTVLGYYPSDSFPEATLIIDEISSINSNSQKNNNNFNNNFQNKNHDFDNRKEDMSIYTSLKHLTTFSRDFIILVRVIKKSEIKHFKSPNQGKLFYFIVLDNDGSEMQCTCFNKAVDKFFNEISEGKVYEIKGGYVKINDKKFTTIKNDYKIVIDENSFISEKTDDGSIKENNLKIINISEIDKIPLYSIIDLCAIVLEVGEKVIKHTRNGDQYMKKIIIGDTSKYKIEFSLWRIHASIEVKVSDTILIKNAKVGEFNGRNLSTFDETSITINPNNSIKEVKELNEFIQNFKGEFNELENKSNDKNSNGNFNNNDVFDRVYIKDVLDSLDDITDVNTTSRITATVTQIMHNEKNFYQGCSDRNCKRKLQFDSENKIYTCPNCKKTYKEPTYYYTLSIRVKDASCEHWIDIFGKTAESIMKISGEEYKDFLNEGNKQKLKEISDSIEFKTFHFWVKPKLQMYSNISKKKLYAYKIEPIDEKNESKKLIKYIKNVINV